MKDDDETVRGTAYVAVARSRPKDPRVLPALVEGLDRVDSKPGWTVPFGHDEGFELSVAIYAMGKEAFPVALENALNHRRPAGRATAALSLRLFLGDVEYAEAMIGGPAHPERFSLPGDAEDGLLRLVEADDYAPMRVAAVDCLSKAGLEGERRRRFDRVLITVLKSTEARLVAAALGAIDEIRPPSPIFVEPLLGLLRQPSEGPDAWRVPRYGVVSTLGRMGPVAAPAVPALRDLLESAGAAEKDHVITALRAIGPDVEGVAEALKAVVVVLRRSLRVEQGGRAERHDAIRALKAVGLEFEGVREALGSIVPQLAEAARGEDRDTRADAINELKSIGPQVDGVAEALRAAVAALGETLRKGGAARSDAIRELLEGFGPEVEGVPDALQSIVPDLAVAARGRDPEARSAAISDLTSIGPEVKGVVEALQGAVPVLVEEAKKRGDTRTDAIRELRFGIGLEVEGVRDALKGLFPGLREELRDPDPSRRLDAVWALGAVGTAIEGVAEALDSARTDPDEDVRQGAESNIRDQKVIIDGKVMEPADSGGRDLPADRPR